MFYIILCSGLVIGFVSVVTWKVAKDIHKDNTSSSGYIDNDIDKRWFDVIIKK